jgi:hypothetical protein
LGEDLQNILEFPKIMFFVGSPRNIFQEIFATSSLKMHNAVFKPIWVSTFLQSFEMDFSVPLQEVPRSSPLGVLIKNASKIVGQPFIFYSKFPPCAYRHTR